MPRITFGFGTYKPGEFAFRLDSLKKAISDWRPGWSRIIPLVNQAIADNFANQGSRGRRWEPLSPKYLKRKLAEGYPPDIMVRTTRLKEAATTFSESLAPGPDQMIVAQETYLGLGVSIDYAYYHDRLEGVRGVQREVFALTEDTFGLIRRELGAWTQEVAGRAWQEGESQMVA